MVACAVCGESNPERARFCLNCGSALAADAPTSRRERRVVTVLFADLVGFTARSERLDVEEVEGVLAPYYALLRGELERFGGTVEKFIGDAVMALFGAPIAHEDDPERAVRAALAIRDRIGELNEREGLELHVRVGVNTGEALVALGADPLRGQGMASGDVINTGARLQAAAPVDGVLVGETTYWATRREVEYAETQAVQAKGKAEPVPAWQALEPRARLGVDLARPARAPLVGRDEELDVLTRALARVRRDHAPQLVTLVGVPGIGKSRLVHELGAIVEHDTELISWRQGRSLPYGEGVTFWALGEMVKAQAGVMETDGADAAEAKVARAVADAMVDASEAAWVAGWLRPLIGVAPAAGLQGDRREEAFAAWRRFFEAVAEDGPLVLVFEDLHFADAALLDFVDHLVDWAAGVPLLVIATTRPELLARRPGWGGGKRNASVVSLEPLGDGDTSRLLAALLQEAQLPAELQQALLEHAGGNPLYAEEFVLMLQDRGFLRLEAGTWRIAGAAQLPLPESVQGLIAARLDALSPDQKRLLQDGAVLGKVVWPGALAAIAEHPAAELEQELHVLERRDFLRRERRSALARERQYAFSHLLVRDVVYGQIPRAERAEKHRRAATWIASLAPDRVEDRAEMLAHHYLQALGYARQSGQPTAALQDPARRALREAGDRAATLNAFTTAARFYRAALELYDEDAPERPGLLLAVGTALLYGSIGGADELRAARESVDPDRDPRLAAQAMSRLAELSWFSGMRDAALAQLSEALALAGDEPSAERAGALNLLSRWRMTGGEIALALAAARELLVLAGELGLEELRAAALNTIGSARIRSGDAGGVEDIQRAIELAGGVSASEEMRALNNLATYFLEHGDLGRAVEHFRAADRLGSRVGVVLLRRVIRGELATAYYLTGEHHAALELAEEEIAAADAGAPHYAEATCRTLRGCIRLGRGDVAGAVADGARAVTLARGAKDPQIFDDAAVSHALALLAAGDRGAAARLGDELLAAWSRDGIRYLPAAPRIAWLAVELGRAGELAPVLQSEFEGHGWAAAAERILAGDELAAAELLDEMGNVTEAAIARQRGARTAAR